MGHCRKYKVSFPAESDISRFYEAIKKFYHVRDADLDAGYVPFAPDNNDISTERIGAGDCTIQAEEVASFRDGWQAYCWVMNGRVDCPSPAEVHDPDISARMDEAVKLARKDGKGRLADLLYAFAGFPTSEQLHLLTGNQIDGYIEASGVGEGEFEQYLRSSGGLGLFLMFRDGLFESNADASLSGNRGGDTEKALVLYNVFKRAGLGPVFVELDMTGISRFDDVQRTRPIVVGIAQNGGGLKLFGFDRSVDLAVPGIRYHPLSIRDMEAVLLSNRMQPSIEYMDSGMATDELVSGVYIEGSMIAKATTMTDIEDAAILGTSDASAFRILLNGSFKLISSDENEKALIQLDAVLAKLPSSWEALYLKGLALKGLGRKEAARTSLEKAASINPNFEWPHLVLGRMSIAENDYEGAINHFEKALSAEPNFSEALYWLAYAERKLGRNEAALGHVKRSLELNSSLAEANYLKGLLLKDLGRFEEAFGSFKDAVKFAKSLFSVYPSMAGALCKAGRAEEAGKVVASLTLELQSAGPGHKELLGLYDAVGLSHEECGQDAVYSGLYVLIGDKFLERDEYEDAERAYGAAIALDPGSQGINFKLMMVRSLMGKDEQ